MEPLGPKTSCRKGSETATSKVHEEKAPRATQDIFGSKKVARSVSLGAKSRTQLHRKPISQSTFAKVCDAIASFPSFVLRRITQLRRHPAREPTEKIASIKSEFSALQGLENQISFLKLLCQAPTQFLTKDLAGEIGKRIAATVIEGAKASPTIGVNQFEQFKKELGYFRGSDFAKEILSTLVMEVMEAPLKAMEEVPISPSSIRLAECAQQVSAIRDIEIPDEIVERAGSCIDTFCQATFSIEHRAVEQGGNARVTEGLGQEVKEWAARSPTSHLVQDTFGRASSIQIGGDSWKDVAGSKEKIVRTYRLVKDLEAFCKKCPNFPQSDSDVGQLVDQLWGVTKS